MDMLNIFKSFLYEYETIKVVQIRSWKVGVIYRLIQLCIILYVTLWVMIIDKGYQTFDYPVSGVTAHFRGISFSNISSYLHGAHVWDKSDIVIPPQQNSGIFITTNMVITHNQTLGLCPESFDTYGVDCETDLDCSAGKLVHLGSGRQTGRCIASDRVQNLTVCEIYGWCPTEYDVLPVKNRSMLAGAENFTILLRNTIEFTTFKKKRTNILRWMNNTYLENCLHDPDSEMNRLCPIFRLGDIIKHSKAKNQNIWLKGGLISIGINWECNLDFGIDNCLPIYTFRRLDDFSNDVGKGWNFRYSHHYVEDDIERRTLIKAYGIQFFITVTGRGGIFDPFAFSMNLGSGLALLGIASVLCDLVILNIVRKRSLYNRARVDRFTNGTVANK